MATPLAYCLGRGGPTLASVGPKHTSARDVPTKGLRGDKMARRKVRDVRLLFMISEIPPTLLVKERRAGPSV